MNEEDLVRFVRKQDVKLVGIRAMTRMIPVVMEGLT
jgi:hypothetical protein